MISIRRGLPAIALCILASGCALGEKMQKIAASITQASSTISSRHEGFHRSAGSIDTRRAAQDVARPWLAGRAQPLARELTLPLALRANVNTTLMFSDGPMDLARLAQRITSVTHIPVHVAPDALLPLEQFLPRLGTAGHSPARNCRANDCHIERGRGASGQDPRPSQR